MVTAALVSLAILAVSIPLLVFGINLSRSAEPIASDQVVGVWRSSENGGTITLRADGSAEIAGVVDHRYSLGSEEIRDVLIDRAEGSWFIGGSMMNEVTVLLNADYDGVSSFHLFTRRPLLGEPYLESIASVDIEGGEQSFHKQ